MKRVLLVGVLLLLLSLPAFAQEVHEELQETVRAEVVAIPETYERDIIGTNTTATVQVLQVRILEGEKENTVVSFENDVLLLEEGDTIFVNRLETIDGVEYFAFKDVDRRGALAVLAVFFVGLLVIFAGQQGVRAVMSLIGSIGVIVFVLVPLLLSGYPPVLTSVAIAAVILALVIFVTHGTNARATIAFAGTVGAVVATGVIATVWVEVAHLTGFASDASVYLNFSTQGALDFRGLLLGSIMIGVLGVLDDVAITQASVVRELKSTDRTLSMYELYRKALRVGRDHIGSLVNTLALAYVGVSLPLVLLFARTDAALGTILNQEVIAAELVRTLVGSIGLILAVPLTTLLAAWWFARQTELERLRHTHYH